LYDELLKYKTLLKVLDEAFGIQPFTVRTASDTLSKRPYTFTLFSLDPDLTADNLLKHLEVKSLSNDIKRLHNMHFLNAKRRKRTITTSTGKTCCRGYEYIYNISKQGEGFLVHLETSIEDNLENVDMSDPAHAAISLITQADIPFGDHTLAYILDGYKPKKKIKNPSFSMRYKKHELMEVFETLRDYSKMLERSSDDTE
jgi:hypothetical protein